MPSKKLHAAAIAAMVVAGPLARAEEEQPILGKTAENWPTQITHRPLTLPKGMVEVWVPVQSNLSKGLEGDPIFVNPSLSVGITDRWQVGVRHFVGFCTNGTSHGCSRVYNDVSLDTLISLGRAMGVEAALGLAVNVAPIENPTLWAGDVQLVLRASGGPFAVTFAPTMSFGLNLRDAKPSRVAPIPFNLSTYNWITPTGTYGNREIVSAPLTLQLGLGRMFTAAAGASVSGPVDPAPNVPNFASSYQIPIGFAGIITPSRWIDLGASFTFRNVGGKAWSWGDRFIGGFAAARF